MKNELGRKIMTEFAVLQKYIAIQQMMVMKMKKQKAQKGVS